MRTEQTDLHRGELGPDAVDYRLFDVPSSYVRYGFNYSPPGGSVNLRETFLARFARIARVSENTLITHGALGAIDLAFRALAPRARRIVTLDPSYREALSLARSHGLAAAAIPRRAGGVDGRRLRRELSSSDVVYVVPALNNPDGHTLDVVERSEIAEAVVASGAALVEDDAYRDLAPFARSLPSLVELAVSVDPMVFGVRLVSFSKTLMPGARCCVVEGATTAIAALNAVKLDFGTCPFAAEYVNALLSDESRWEAILAATRSRLDAGRAAALDGLAGWPMEVFNPGAGYFLWLAVGEYPAAKVVNASADELGVLLADGNPFFVNPNPAQYVRLSVSWESPERIASACRSLTACWAPIIGAES